MEILTIKKLKEIIATIPAENDDCPVIIPIVDEDDSNKQCAYRIVNTAGIIHEDGEIGNGDALILAPSKNGLDISEQIKYNHRDNNLFGTSCKKVLF